MNTLLALCIIVFSAGTNGDWHEKRAHEMAHCWGWQHPEKQSAFGKAYRVPQEYLDLGDYPDWWSPCGLKACSTERAMKLCDGHFGCQRWR